MSDWSEVKPKGSRQSGRNSGGSGDARRDASSDSRGSWSSGGRSSRDRRPPGPRCLCVSRSATFLPNADGGHTRRAHFCDARSSSATTPLLGGLAQFCAAFYHANSWEADVRLCLHEQRPDVLVRLQPTGDAASPARAALEVRCGPSKGGPREVIKDLPFSRCCKSQVAIVARLVGAGGDELYVARYANCLRGRSEDNTHAEEFLLADAALADAIARAAAGARLELLMTYQPCHHSGGRLRPVDAPPAAAAPPPGARAASKHPTSCSVRLLEWCEAELRPRGVALVLAMADLYKVLWEDDRHPSEAELRPRGVALVLAMADLYKVLWEDDRHPSEAERVVYSAKRTYGRDGMRMLLAAGVAMRAFDDDDWAFLVSLCDGAVRDAYARRGAAPPFTAAHVEARRRMDAYNAAFLRKLQAEVVASSDP